MDMFEIDRSLASASTTLLSSVWRHKITFVATCTLVFVPAMLGLLCVRPTYEGETLLVSGQVDVAQGPDQQSRPSVTPDGLSHIAESDEVISAAVEKVGLARVLGGPVDTPESVFQRIQAQLFPSRVVVPRDLSPLEVALPRIRRGLTVHSDHNSDVIRIAYRNKDPIVAAAFVNAVAQAFVDRQILLYSRAGEASFFKRQQQEFEDRARVASDILHRFETRTGFYSASDQKQLLLKRLNDLNAARAYTDGLIGQKTGQQFALAEALHKLAPVARSPYVSALVDDLSGGRNADTGGSIGALLERTADPPQLLIKVYQDAMVSLFQTNADLAGARNLEKEQSAEVAGVRTELDQLTMNEQEFGRLSREVSQAIYNADTFAKRMVEEQINAELSAAKFSSLKVIERASVPLRPVSPTYTLVTIAIILGSLFAGAGAAFTKNSVTKTKSLL